MEINPSEVTKILKEQIKNFGDKAEVTDNANPEMAIFKGIDDVCLKADIAPSDLIFVKMHFWKIEFSLIFVFVLAGASGKSGLVG